MFGEYIAQLHSLDSLATEVKTYESVAKEDR